MSSKANFILLRIYHSAVLPNLSISPSLNIDIPHLDHRVGKVPKEESTIVAIALD